MRIVLAHSHANTFGGGERAVLELGRALMSRHNVHLLLGAFNPRRTYPELASLPHTRFGRLQWFLSRVKADAVVANSFGSNLLALRNGTCVAYWVHSTRSLFLQPGARRADLLLRRGIDWLAVRRAALLVANSRYTAARLRQEADAYRARVIAQADGDAQRFNRVLDEYRKAPQVTRDRMYIDTMQQVYSNVSKVFVDSRTNDGL